MLKVEQLNQWVESVLTKHPEVETGSEITLTPLVGDAGFRQYFGVNTQPELLAVMAPKANSVSESAGYFASLSSSLRQQGVLTPTVLACSKEDNFLLIERFIGCDLFDVLSLETVDTLYAEALLSLLRLQQTPRNSIEVANYGAKLLRDEMELFRQWFIGDLLAYTLTSKEHALLDELFDFLIEQALSQPQVLVHRDYHSRNLIYQEGKPQGVIDFQDAVWGPITYDVVSLLRDCYIRWSPEQVRQWALSYGNMAHDMGLLPETSTTQFLQWFDTMGLQRHIKVLGIFARLSLRDNKHRYLDDLPLVMRYVLEIANVYPETQNFASWFEQSILPQVEKHAWYKNYLVAGDHS